MEIERRSKKPKKKGKPVRLQDNSPALVNDKGQAYRVSVEVLSFWNLCDGSKTERDLVEVIKRTGDTEEAAVKAVDQVITILREADLLQ